MEIFLSPQAWLSALGIFALRIMDVSLGTVRVRFVIRGKRLLSWILGFFEVLIFVVAISTVLQNLGNPLNAIGYAAGFATGNVLGIMIEEKLAIGFIHFLIISPFNGSLIAGKLRDEGYGVTVVAGRGRDGTVNLLHCDIRRRNLKKVENLVKNIDSEAFITVEDIQPIHRGFLRK
ncbi:MAG: DUF2179 domain-containing protein [Anaerolineaceae bacterium]|nr:DUF2179 domain-containing protein [Anaerolineaceae bacterium]